MVVVRFSLMDPADSDGIVTHDWVGGRMPRVEPLGEAGETQSLQVWSWREGPSLSEKRQRLVTIDVGATPDASRVEPSASGEAY